MEREEGSEARGRGGPRVTFPDWEAACTLFGTDYIDVFNVQYIQPDEDMGAVVAALEEVARWREKGEVR